MKHENNSGDTWWSCWLTCMCHTPLTLKYRRQLTLILPIDFWWKLKTRAKNKKWMGHLICYFHILIILTLVDIKYTQCLKHIEEDVLPDWNLKLKFVYKFKWFTFAKKKRVSIKINLTVDLSGCRAQRIKIKQR